MCVCVSPYGVLANVLDSCIVVRKLVIPKLWGKWYHFNSFTRRVLALNNPRSLIYH